MSQGQTPGFSHPQAPDGDRSHPADERIREQLSRVLASHEFRSSKRSQDFLRYVVEHTLTGHADMLKERTIGIEVFGRSTSYDPSDDATVRVKAGEVRKRLGLYYSDQGASDPIRIELPSGTYIPEFHWTGAAGGVAPEVAPLSAPLVTHAPPEKVAPQPEHSRKPLWIAASALAVIAVAFLWFKTGVASTPLDEFWSPVLKGSSPVLLCAAFVPVYGRENDADPNSPVHTEDFTRMTDQFVGGGDLIAVSRLTAMLTRMKHPYRLKVGNDVSFPDLRTGPAVLVGYSYTRWKEISSQMRYFIDGSRKPVGITDNGHPTDWALPDLPRDRRTSEDYAIVSRVFHPDTHAMLVEIAGITQYGTDAGSDLVTNPDLMAEALRGAPQGWQTKNMQFVLHVKVISGAPSSPKVVGHFFW